MNPEGAIRRAQAAIVQDAMANGSGSRAPEDLLEELPEIRVGARQLPASTADALAALQAANSQPHLFVRSGRMVSVIIDDRDLFARV